ncbi:Crp/Fnr family transcriptional regulator [Pedobacter psychroterrae]|nr:cyclic nucleotide-binding domain-containing protein [Pedobacter psychroterrae]
MEGYVKLGVKFKLALRSVLHETSYKKGARILSSGSVQHNIWFLLDGLAREIRVHPDTFEENTVWFWFSGSFLFSTPGLFNRVPSESTIELLEDCRVVLISYQDWARLKEVFGENELVTEKIRGGYDSVRQQLGDDIRNLSTDQRYLKHEPVLDNLFGRTQLRYVAEYMGMSPDRLGRLRRKYNNGA